MKAAQTGILWSLVQVQHALPKMKKPLISVSGFFYTQVLCRIKHLTLTQFPNWLEVGISGYFIRIDLWQIISVCGHAAPPGLNLEGSVPPAKTNRLNPKRYCRR